MNVLNCKFAGCFVNKNDLSFFLVNGNAFFLSEKNVITVHINNMNAQTNYRRSVTCTL